MPFTSPAQPSTLSAQLRVELATKAVAIAPQNANLWLGLASAHAEVENWAAATEAAREAVHLRGDYITEARLKLADISLLSGNPADALAALKSEPPITSAQALALAATVLECMGQWEAAIAKHSQLLESSGDGRLLKAWTYLDPTISNAIRVEQRCLGLLRRHLAAQLIEDLMIAFAIQHKGELIREWANPEHQIVEVNIDDIYALSAKDLCRLQGEIMALPDLNWVDNFRSSVRAWRTDLTEQNSGPALRDLLAAFTAGIRLLSSELRFPPMHPWSRSGKADLRIFAWVVLTWSEGYHKPHLHHGIFSGTFYVTRPTDLLANAGQLVFGPPAELPNCLHSLWPVRRVDPTPGKLVLFPSYMSHATNATNAEEPRICVAFNAH